MTPTRREFLKLCVLSSTFALGCNPIQGRRKIPGSLLGNNSKTGHLLREGALPLSSGEERVSVVIIGAGISGLIAARELQRAGREDFIVLELDESAGGNSSFGQNKVSSFPWGAHYVPVPNRESEFVIALFRELELIQDDDSSGRPKYFEEHLCHEPEERLYIHGKWQSTLLPDIGISEDERRQAKEFLAHIETLKEAVGGDGKPAFAIPIDLSSRDQKFLELDALSFAEYLDSKAWTAKPLRWYTNYCCRDDYGTTEAQTSAWAGLHYFAGRRPYAANTSSYELLTWPEGNGWIVRRLLDTLPGKIRTNSLVYKLRQSAHETAVEVFDTKANRSYTIRADYLIFSAPRFTLPYLLSEKSFAPEYLHKLSYSPWMVANVTIQNYANISAFAWDNVSYHSNSLGYVVATHQNLFRQNQATVLTWYLPLSAGDPKEERQKALATPLEQWQDLVIDDLRRMHPDIEKSISNIDIRLWGHAMPRPIPGFFTSAARQEMQKPFGRIYFAHSDMSGISIFEEAQYRGVLAGREVAGLLGKKA